MTTLRARAELSLAGDRSSVAHGSIDAHRLLHELRVHEAELELQNEELENANIKMAAALAEQRRVYQALSHDLAQPVFALRLFLQTLAASSLDPEQRKLLTQLVSSANALGELSAALSSLSNDTAGHEPQWQRVALGPLLERALNDHLPLAQQKSLRVRLAPTTATTVSDPMLLRRIVSNLIANAIAHTAAGTILIGVRRQHGGSLRIEVRDTGCGIDKSAQERIFDEFYQVGNAERNPAKGLGLGLAIARRLADTLGLGLSVRSALHRGSIFSVSLPASRRPVARPLRR